MKSLSEVERGRLQHSFGEDRLPLTATVFDGDGELDAFTQKDYVPELELVGSKYLSSFDKRDTASQPSSEVQLKVRSGEVEQFVVCEGNNPVSATIGAYRKAFSAFGWSFPETLVHDYDVRLGSNGSAADVLWKEDDGLVRTSASNGEVSLSVVLAVQSYLELQRKRCKQNLEESSV